MPQLDDPGDGEDTQPRGKRSHCRLGAEQELSPIEMIGRKTVQGQQKGLGSELECHHHTDRGRIAMGQLGKHEPVLGSALHPCSHLRDEPPAGPRSLVKAGHRTESALHRSTYKSAVVMAPMVSG